MMTEPASSRTWSRDLILLTLVLCAFYGFRLGSYALANPDEGRNAEIAREMVASGDWVTPRLDGVNYFEKPPLVYWAVAGSLTLFGPNEGSVRAVPLLFAIGAFWSPTPPRAGSTDAPPDCPPRWSSEPRCSTSRSGVF